MVRVKAPLDLLQQEVERIAATPVDDIGVLDVLVLLKAAEVQKAKNQVERVAFIWR